MKLSNTQNAYLAGFFDGEGTFSLQKRPDKRSPIGYTLQPYVEVASTNKEIIVWLHKKIGKGFTFWRPRNKNAKDAYALHITGMETIIPFIDNLYPYLIVKKQVAKELKKFCLSRRGKMQLPLKKRGLTSKEIEMFNQIRKLNKRGR